MPIPELNRLLMSPDKPPAQTINDTPIFKVYPERWLVLAICCFLALSNAMQWISYSSLAAQTQLYYRGVNSSDSSGYDVALLTNQIFQIVMVFTGLFGMYITDHLGIRIAGLLGTSLNIVGATIRLIASIPTIQSFLAREILLHTGSFFSAGAQAFFLVLPSKIAECWFPCDQRAIANVLSFVANPAGVALGTIVPSLIFDSGEPIRSDSWKFFEFSLGMNLLALIPFALAVCLRRKLPPTPPSAASAAHHSTEGFFSSVTACVRNFQFVVEMFLFAFAFALLWSFMIFLDGVLTLKGYDLQGYPTAVSAIVGTITSLLAGYIADKTRKFKEILRFCTIGFAISMISLRLYCRYSYAGPLDSAIVYILCGLLGAFSIPQFPIGVELGVETTFPILEATSSGVLVIFGSLWMFIVPFINDTFQRFDWIYEPENGFNWQLSMDISCGLACTSVILSCFFLKPRYLRMELEENPTEVHNDTEDTSCPKTDSFEMHSNL